MNASLTTIDLTLKRIGGYSRACTQYADLDCRNFIFFESYSGLLAVSLSLSAEHREPLFTVT